MRYCASLALVLASAAPGALADGATVLYNDTVVNIEETLSDPNDLWVSPDDLTRINGFVLKPEGACLDEICIVAREDVDGGLVVNRDGKQWFNVTELARKLQQAFVHDAETGVWSFGAIPVTRASFLDSALAPDFELVDREGNTIRLSDYRGKKVMIITWASW
jgi:hypothetical protein